MCGIAGFVTRDLGGEGLAEGLLGAMLDTIVHRGPDGEGVLLCPELGYFAGMRRLSIIDLEGGGQPIANEDGSVSVLFNGEIYNHVELRVELEGKGHVFRTRSDTEVLVHLYEEHGAGLVHKLRGMFAFALLDRARGRLLLARDHFGQKPLYYHVGGGRLAFASELKALLELPFVPVEPDGGALLDYVSWFSLPPGETHLRGVRKLPAGCLMEVELGRELEVSSRVYWRFEQAEDGFGGGMDEAAEEAGRQLQDSVGVHLRSDVPVGVLLSSGLDSKLIGVTAGGLHCEGLATFTAGYDEEGSEFEGAAQTAHLMGSRHHEVRISAEDLAADVGRVAWHLDEPVADPAAFAVLRVCELARQHVKVLLSGEGADELFAGYAQRYEGMLQTLQRSDKLRRLALFLPRPGVPFPGSRLGRMSRRAHTSREMEMLALRVEGLPGDVRRVAGLNEEQLQRLLRREEELAERLIRRQRDDLHTLLALDMDWQLAESLLQKADKMSMAASIELRTPFLDVRLAEFAARVPSGMKLSDGIGKRVLRRHLARLDATESEQRPKRGFPIPLDAWFRGPLRDQVHDEVFREGAAWRGVLDDRLIRDCWRDLQSGAGSYGRVFYALWLYERWVGGLSEKVGRGSGLKVGREGVC